MIRPARQNDAPALARLLDALGYPDADGGLATRLARLLAHADAALLVADCEGQVAGFVALHFIAQLGTPGDFCRISYFCVDPAQRSRGIGRTLEEAVVALASERGCDRIELHCHSRRTAAHAFYARQGYLESPRYLLKSLAPTLLQT